MSANPVAYWSISLDTECPECQAEFNLIDLDSFTGSSINPLERVRGYEITCPHCEAEYLLDLEF